MQRSTPSTRRPAPSRGSGRRPLGASDPGCSGCRMVALRSLVETPAPPTRAVMASTLEMFDLQRGSMTNQIPMRIPRAFERALPLQDGRILAVGGTSLDQGKSRPARRHHQIFDPYKDPGASRVDHRLCDDAIVDRACGRAGTPPTNVFGPNIAVFDPSTDRLSTLPGRAPLTATAVVFADGRVLLTEAHAKGASCPRAPRISTPLRRCSSTLKRARSPRDRSCLTARGPRPSWQAARCCTRAGRRRR